MIQLNQLREFLKTLLPEQGVVDFGPNGLQVEGKAHVKKLVTGVSADLKTIESAVSQGADALIVHHGLFW